MHVRRPDSRLVPEPYAAPRGGRFRRPSLYRRRDRVRVVLRRMGGAATLLCALFGLPAALFPTRQVWLDVAADLDVAAAVAQPLNAPVLLLAVLAAGWLLWAWLVVATVLDTAAVFMRGARTVRVLPAPLQSTVTMLAGSLLMAVTSVTAGASAAGAAPPSGAATHTTGLPAAALPAATAGAAVPDLRLGSANTSPLPLGQVTSATPGKHRQPMTVTVRHGDTLWVSPSGAWAIRTGGRRSTSSTPAATTGPAACAAVTTSSRHGP